MKDRQHDDAVAELFREDPALVIEMLNDILEDGDQGELLTTLRQLTKAFGGMTKVAEQAELNLTQIYRTLSDTGNPALGNFTVLLETMGLRLAVQAIASHGPQT